MNSLIIVLGSVLLGGPAMANEQESTSLALQENFVPSALNRSWAFKDLAQFGEGPKMDTQGKASVPTGAPMDEIVFLEVEAEIDLGFDTADYLPLGFDPHKSYFDLNAIGYWESEPEVELGFDTKVFLPADFNAYTNVVDLSGINFMEPEEAEELELGFDTADYLPEGFSPYRSHWDLGSIPEMEEEFPWETELNSGLGLPQDFDPYTNIVGVGAISFMEPEDMALGFETFKYLPKDFDPYAGSKQ